MLWWTGVNTVGACLQLLSPLLSNLLCTVDNGQHADTCPPNIKPPELMLMLWLDLDVHTIVTSK